MDTLRLIPWHEGTALLMADLAWQDGRTWSPRRDRSCAGSWRAWPSAVEATAGTELEFIVFKDSYEDAWRKGYRDLDPANLYNVDYSMIGTAGASRFCGASATRWRPQVCGWRTRRASGTSASTRSPSTTTRRTRQRTIHAI